MHGEKLNSSTFYFHNGSLPPRRHLLGDTASAMPAQPALLQNLPDPLSSGAIITDVSRDFSFTVNPPCPLTPLARMKTLRQQELSFIDGFVASV